MAHLIPSEHKHDFMDNETRFSEPYYMKILDKLIEESRREIYEQRLLHEKDETESGRHRTNQS